MNIAMLTPGFWPTQCGMELFFHNLAQTLTASGHRVFLFAPLPRQKYTEIQTSYRLIRFTGEHDFFEKFEVVHRGCPCNVMLVQSALGATSMALKLRRKFKIPIVLRPHGEDIQFVPEVGYGWRLDPAKNEAICDNIKAVDACVAISPRVEELIRTISAETPTVLIPNGDPATFLWSTS